MLLVLISACWLMVVVLVLCACQASARADRFRLPPGTDGGHRSVLSEGLVLCQFPSPSSHPRATHLPRLRQRHSLSR